MYYSENSMLNCSIINTYTLQQKSEKIQIQIIDQIAFTILCPIGLLSSFFIIITYIKLKDARKQPADILLAISISEAILCLHWFSSAIYQFKLGGSPESDGLFCYIESFFSLGAGISEFMYNCLLCLYMMMIVKNNLRGNTIKAKYFHIFAILIIIGGLIFIFAKKQQGLSLFGTCSVAQEANFSYQGLMVAASYVMISSLILIYFKKYIPQTEQYQSIRKNFLDYYVLYITATSIIWSIIAISNFIVGMNCFHWQLPLLNTFITIGNLSKLCTPLILAKIRYNDPIIKKYVQIVISRCRRCINKKKSAVKPLIDNQSENESNFYFKLSNQLRISQVYTILSGVSICLKETTESSTLSLEEITEVECNQTQTIQINDEKISQYPQFKLNFSAYESKITLYAPKFFKTLVMIDRKMINTDVSFNMEKNIMTIKEQFSGDGGRSGEFFYFSADNKLLIKTLKEDEKNSILGKIYYYCQHFSKNEDSLISKIYGIFTIHREGLNEKEHVILMRNIAPIERLYVQSCYDLKGSSIDREVLIKNPDALNKKKTLKDLDFQKIEGKIFVNKSTSQQISDSLVEDSKFLSKMGWLDYSLLVFKVNWAQYSIDNDISEQYYLKNQFINPLYYVPSTKEPGIYYHMAIIDYLQDWNKNKIIEANFKIIKNIDLNADISSINPLKYAQRFQEKIANEIFIKNV